MSFKFHNHYQRMQKFGCVAPLMKTEKMDADGNVKVVERSSAENIPVDASLFDLETSIKARVNLERVPTKIVDNGMTTDALVYALEHDSLPQEEIKPQIQNNKDGE